MKIDPKISEAIHEMLSTPQAMDMINAFAELAKRDDSNYRVHFVVLMWLAGQIHGQANEADHEAMQTVGPVAWTMGEVAIKEFLGKQTAGGVH